MPKRKYKFEEEEKEKYKNSKYLTSKYKNYLNTEENLDNSISKEKYKINKINNNYSNKSKNNNLYNNRLFEENQKDVQMALNTDHLIINPIQNNINISNINIINKENYPRKKELRKKDLSVDRLNIIDNNMHNLTNDDIGEELLNNGFFAGKSKKKNNNNYYNKSEDSIYKNDEEDKYASYNMKVNQLIDKYKKIKELFKKNNININQNYDYVKKCRGNAADIYGINNTINNTNINDDFTKSFNNNEDYDKIFRPKNKSKARIIRVDNTKKTKSAKSAYNMSIKNIIDNLDTKKDNNINNNNISNNNISTNYKNLINSSQYFDYDDLINNISNNQNQNNRYHKIDKKQSSITLVCVLLYTWQKAVTKYQ